jgi:hypothetical protein
MTMLASVSALLKHLRKSSAQLAQLGSLPTQSVAVSATKPVSTAICLTASLTTKSTAAANAQQRSQPTSTVESMDDGTLQSATACVMHKVRSTLAARDVAALSSLLLSATATIKKANPSWQIAVPTAAGATTLASVSATRQALQAPTAKPHTLSTRFVLFVTVSVLSQILSKQDAQNISNSTTVHALAPVTQTRSLAKTHLRKSTKRIARASAHPLLISREDASLLSNGTNRSAHAPAVSMMPTANLLTRSTERLRVIALASATPPTPKLLPMASKSAMIQPIQPSTHQHVNAGAN